MVIYGRWLSCLKHRSEIFNETSFDDWVNEAKAPALPASLRFYKELQNLGFRIFLLTGRSEFQRQATETNLLFSGYTKWDRLILRYTHLNLFAFISTKQGHFLIYENCDDLSWSWNRDQSDQGKPATIYKSERRQELVNEGYRIHGSSGDQWSDLLGFAVASRSFKLPNPMYFIL